MVEHVGGAAWGADGGAGQALAAGGQVLLAGVVAQQPVIEHAPGDGGGGGGPETRVFHNHGQGDFGLVCGGIGDVQRMVALALGQFGGVVALFLADGHGLGGAGFARRGVRCAGKNAPCGAFYRDGLGGFTHGLDVFGLVAQGQARRLRQGVVLPRDGINAPQAQMRLVLHAPVGQHGRGVGQLQHGEVVVALANAQGNGLAGVPAFLFRAFVGVALPLHAGQHAGGFALQVNAGGPPKAHGREVVVDQVHAHVVGQHVVVHVGRFDDGAAQIGRPIGVARAEGVATKGPAAVVLDGGVDLALARFQPRQAHEGFVGGAGRVGAPQGPVEQGAVDGGVEQVPVFLVNAANEQVDVVARLAYHGQHFAIARVDGDQGPPALAKQVLNQLLQAHVQAQHQGVARYGIAAVQAAHGKAAGGGL